MKQITIALCTLLLCCLNILHAQISLFDTTIYGRNNAAGHTKGTRVLKRIMKYMDKVSRCSSFMEMAAQ